MVPMTMEDALKAIEDFLAEYQANHDWNPVETKVLPSGDEADHIKIWFNFGEGATDVDSLKNQPIEALKAAHPELSEFTIEVRADAF